MSKDLRDRLRQLGVHQGAAKVTAKPRSQRKTGIEQLIDGEIIDTDYGPAFVHIERYPPDHVHGAYALGELLSQSWQVAGHLADFDDEEIDLRRAIFLDTETTGLTGGTGTLAFLIGVGTFEEDDSFALRQFFLRSPAEEPALLLHLAEWLDQYGAVVSFNGRGFDLPLLQTRFMLHRLRPGILTAPHLDLLAPARRVWRGRLASCSLSSLEYHILDVQRDQVDIDGALIPQMYFDYVRTGDAGEMPRVLYHNAYDILSTVTLATHLLQMFDREQATDRDAGDLYALGKWHADRDQIHEAEKYLRQAIALADDADTHHAAALRLAAIYKRIDRRADALLLWETVTDQPTLSAIDACIELAKHYEWHHVDLPQALKWTQRGLTLAQGLPRGFVRDELTAALEHRQARLLKRIGRIA